MSGGGIFDAQGRLVGIHRSQTTTDLEFGAVSAEKIRVKLRGARLGGRAVARDAEGPHEPFAVLHSSEAQAPNPGAGQASNMDPSGRIRERKPLGALGLTLKPDSFLPAEPVEPALTDASGRAVLRVIVPTGVAEDALQGCRSSARPSPLPSQNGAPLMARSAAIPRGNGWESLGEPLSLAATSAVAVNVVPYAERDRYYVSQLGMAESIAPSEPRGTPRSTSRR